MAIFKLTILLLNILSRPAISALLNPVQCCPPLTNILRFPSEIYEDVYVLLPELVK
jgi:hypothetical protein